MKVAIVYDEASKVDFEKLEELMKKDKDRFKEYERKGNIISGEL